MNKPNATHSKVAHRERVHTSSANGTNSDTNSSPVSEKHTTQRAKHKDTKDVVKESMLSRILNFPQRLWHRFS